MAWFFLLQALQAQAAFVLPNPPTGAHPRFIAQIPKLKADWAQLKADAANNIEPAATWYSYLTNHATEDSAVPSSWLTRHTITMYQITGDSSWATLAWKSVQGNFINKYSNYDYSCCNTSYVCCPSSSGAFYDGDNNARIILGYWVDHYDWLYTFLTAPQRQLFRDKLANLVDYTLRGNGNCCDYSIYNSWPLRSTDSDVTIHNYFSILKYYATTADENPHAVRLWNDPRMNLGGVTPEPIPSVAQCGNNCYNSSDLGINLRTAVYAHLAKYSSGGTGQASTGYNLEGEMNKVAYDWAGCLTAFGVDYFPEIPENLLRWGMQYASLGTPDMQWIYRWGDDEVDSNPQAALFIDLSVVSGTTSWFITDPRQDQIRDYAKKLFAAYGSGGQWKPYDEFFYAYQHMPTATVSDFRAGLPAPGGKFSWDLMGTGTYHTGWTGTDSMFGFEYAAYSEIDHFTQHVGNFQLYRKGEWGVYTPISYGRPTSSGEATNTMNFYGFPDGGNFYFIREFKGLIDFYSGSDYAFFIGANAGTHRYPGAWYTPPNWQQEYTRSVLYVHGTNADHVLVFDRTDIVNPQSAGANWKADNWWGSNPAVANYFSTKPRKLWQWYCHQNPTIDSTLNQISFKAAHLSGDVNNGYTWAASTTQTVTIRAHFTRTSYSSTPITSLPNSNDFYLSDTEKKGYLVKETCRVDQEFDATVHVATVGNAAFTPSSMGISSSDQKTRAVVVARLPDPDIVAFYHTLQGPSIPNNNCGSDNGSPCQFDPRTASIVPTQHVINATNYYAIKVTIAATAMDLYVHDLPTTQSYSVWVDRIQRGSFSSTRLGGMQKLSITNLTVGSHDVCVQPNPLVAEGCSTSFLPDPPTDPPLPSQACGWGGTYWALLASFMLSWFLQARVMI